VVGAYIENSTAAVKAYNCAGFDGASLTVGIPEGWELQFSENPIFGPNFFYSLLRPKKQQIRNKNYFFCSTKFRARAPSNFIVVKYSKSSRAGF
jgi:hypothetical protein